MRTLQNVIPSPEQLKILTDVEPGFRLIRGAAGSGKTTAALLRLRQLCSSRASRRARLGLVAPVRVLVLAFNRTLRGYMQQLATEQVRDSEAVRLTIDTLSRWAWNLAGQPSVLDDDGRWMIGPILEDIGISPEHLGYFIDEVKYIQGRFPPDQRDRYLEATRSGRGRAPAVPRSLRSTLLTDVLDPYEVTKSQTGTFDWNDLALEAARVPSQRYDVVIVDESQDLSANQIRAILTHLDEDHVTTFIADSVQRIYPQGFQWSELGINMRPQMVFTLTRNHRNTAEIAQLASSLVRGLPQDDDGVPPNEGACEEHGPRPKVVEGTYSQQLDCMLQQVLPRLALSETVAILQPKGGGWFGSTKRVLRQRNIQYCELTRRRVWPTGPEQLALSTIHSAKGLEFDHVLMPGLNKEVTPHGSEDGDGTLEALRRLIAMGVGRARKTVMLGYKPGERSSVFGLIDTDTYDLVRV